MKKIYLSKSDRKIFGLCGGLSEAFNIDPTLVRLIMVFLCLLTGIVPLAITYLISGIITPDKPR
jgi:phage shock protein C